MAKKAKAGSRRKGGALSKGKRGPTKSRNEDQNTAQSQQNPYDRVNFVRPLWETLDEDKRVELLTVNLEDVRARALEHLEKSKNEDRKNCTQDASSQTHMGEINVEEVLEEGLKRLKEQGTWKVWSWGPSGKPYIDAEAFRRETEAEHIAEDLQQLLPRDVGKSVEKPAEAALRDRMTLGLELKKLLPNKKRRGKTTIEAKMRKNKNEALERISFRSRFGTNLLSQIHVQLQNAQDAWRRGQRNNSDQMETVVRDGNIDLVIAILEALQQEHHCLYQTILTPVTDFVCSQLPIKSRKSSRSELFFEDLEKLPPDEIARLYEWLTEKVDSLCAKLKPDPKDEEVEEEETVGDIDLFSLTANGGALTVNPKWLHHLQERRLSEEGQPRKVKDGEDEQRVGLVLEWVYGSIVSTAEKARDGAKRPLGTWEPSIKQAHENLCAALRDQRDLEARSKKAKELLKAMVETRKNLAKTMENSEFVIPGTPAAREPSADTSTLPDDLLVMVLKREELLTQAKLHVLQYDRMMGDSQLRSLRAELMQVGATNGEDAKQAKGEPEFERLRRELDDVKNTPRGLEGTFRTAAEKERHRAQLADSLLEEQLEVQSAFREQSARLQGIYDKRQRTEIEMAKREQEITQLRNWQRNVNQLVSKFTALCASPDGDVEEGGQKAEAKESSSSAPSGAEETALEALRVTFHRDFKKQLYSDIDDMTFFSRIKKELKHMERRLEDGAVVLQHLEMFLINVACNDPGAAIGSLLVLPLLQERLDKEAMEFATHRASLAEEEILRMEENEKQEADAQKRLSKAKKVKDKLRREKERKAAEQKAKEAAEQAETEEQNKKDLERIEEEKRKEEAARLEKLRKEEEEMMEHRRQELLSEENGYWRMRMESDASSKGAAGQKTAVGSNEAFTSVGGHRRRGHERRSSWGGSRMSGHDGIGRRGSSGHGDGYQRRHNNQDANRRGGQHRRIKSDAEALTGRASSNSAKETAPPASFSKHGQKTSFHSMSSRPHRGAPSDVSKTQSSGAHNVWNHPDKRSHRATQSRPAGQKVQPRGSHNAPAPQQCAQNQVVEAAKPTSAAAKEQAAVVVTPVATAQKPVVAKKTAWVKGSIPASVIGRAKGGSSAPGDAGSKESDSRQSKIVGSGSGSVTTDVSINSPATPDATEADAPSIKSDGSNSQKVASKSPSTGLPHIKTVAAASAATDPENAKSVHSNDAIASPPSQQPEGEKASAGFAGSGEQFFQMVQSVSAVEEEEDTKEVSEVGSNADDADDESQPSGFESGQESSPTAPVLLGPPVPPPFGMPMGGPMGPMAGYHPGSMPWMRPMSGMGPSMRPMYPFMAPPPNFIHPPAVSAAPQSPPSASGPPSASSPATSGAPVNDPVRPPGGPMYFYPPHMMPHGPPVMQPFMPMMPGHWVGYPMGPHPPPFMGPGQMSQKKFTLRPTAKEFIPPSMLNDGASECGSEEKEDVTAEAATIKAVTPAIEQEV